MSHEIPQNNPYESVDVERPYLMPRNSGKIEVWHVETNEDGTPKVDDQGWIVLSGQNEELNAEGELSRSSKAAHPEALTDEVQGHFADILGQSQLYATPEHFERYGGVNEDLAETALEAMGLESEDNEQAEGRSQLLTEFFEETRFDAIDELKHQVMTRTSMIEDELTQLDNVLTQAMYAGGSNDMFNTQLRNSFESLRQLMIGRDKPDEELSGKIAPLIHRAIEINDTIRRDESSSDESRYDAGRLEESVGELDMSNKTISQAYHEIRQAFMPHGKFESELEELMRTNQGYEMTISLLKSSVSNVMDAVSRAKARMTGIGYALEDLDRLKNR